LVDLRKRSKEEEEHDRWDLWGKRIRDLAVFTVGIAGSVNEVFWVTEPRPPVLFFLASLLGVPIMLAVDEARRARGGNGGGG
jgi:hypothetical protein